MKRFIVAALAVLFPLVAVAADFSMAEGNLAAEFGVNFQVTKEDGQRLATGFSADNRQAVRFWGEADEYSRAQAMVDMRPANAAKGRRFLVAVAKWTLDDAQWGAAERFIDDGLARLKVGEKAAQKLGGCAVEVERASDVQAVLRIGGER